MGNCCESESTKQEVKEGKTAEERKVAWETIRAKLPRSKTLDDKKRRIELFQEFDKDKSESLTLEETYDGCVNILHLDEFTTRLREIVKRAFNKAKDMGTKDRNAGADDKVEFLEFRLMLCYIYDYFELTVMFDEIDTSGNMFIDKEEFNQAVPKIQEWGLPIDDPEATFKEIDDNGTGKLSFDEFAAWASSKKLSAGGDPDGEIPPAADRSLPEDVKEGKNAAERKAAWEKIRAKLPRAKTAEDKARRIALFKEFDKDDSKSLTLEETYQGCIDILHLDEFTTRLRPITRRAFNKAKDLGTKDRNEGADDLVEFLEFRLMLCYIYDYFELTTIFDEIDTSGDMFLEEAEFKEAVTRLQEWGLKIDDASATFKEIDGNGSGKVSFDEFAAWASSKKLSAGGDPDK